MKVIKFIFIILLYFLCLSCSKKEVIKSEIKEKDLNLQVIEAYNEGMKSFKSGDVLFAALKFNEAEILYPQSELAPRAALMAAYSYYTQDYYSDVIAEIERFLKVYPNHKNIDYAYYLLATTYYEQIVDEEKDLESIINAKINFKFILNNFPMTDYAKDAKFKIDLINDILASKEMYIGRYYLERKKWIPAINRFKTVINDYDTTIYTEEALYRLVEIHYLLGLEDESKKYAKLLGYNYRSSIWYEKSYSFFYRNYAINNIKIQKSKKKKKKFLINKFKSLFD